VGCQLRRDSVALFVREFFGHRKGAYTSVTRYPRFLDAAHQGTLFLDESANSRQPCRRLC
jgi:transcriptional regulator with AAA-type ATPase domain